MSNQKQCTPTPAPASPIPAEWNESAAFRETTLQYFTAPGQADVLRSFGAILHDNALESAADWPIVPGYGTTAQLRAGAADLRFLQGYLAHAGHDRHVSSLKPEEPTLAELAERLATEVGRIAETIEQAIA